MKKRDRDVARKRYFKEKERLADLLNLLIREQTEKEAEISLVKGNAFTIISPEFSTVTQADTEAYSRIRTVDIASMLYTEEGQYYFFVENQELPDYTMPERLLNCESICYHEQVHLLRKQHKLEKDWKSKEEKLCGFSAEDKLVPVISAVVYYGVQEWGQFRTLSQMMKLNHTMTGLKGLVNDYRIHLIDVKRFEHLEWLQTDLHETFGFIRYANDEERLRAFVKENRQAFEHLAEDAYDFIAYQTGTRKLEKYKIKYINEEGECDMCKAIDDMMKHSREEGRKYGEDRMLELVERLLQEDRLQDVQKLLKNKRYRNSLYKRYGL